MIKEVRQCLFLGSLSTKEVEINTCIIIRQNVVIALRVTNKLVWDLEQRILKDIKYLNISVVERGCERLMQFSQEKAGYLIQKIEGLQG